MTGERVYLTLQFLTRMEMRREAKFRRGAEFKSITIVSLYNRNLRQYSQYATMMLDEFFRTRRSSCHINIDYKDLVREILQHYYDCQADVLTGVDRSLARYAYFDKAIETYDIEGSDVVKMIDVFGYGLILAYRELLHNGRIIILSTKHTILSLNRMVRAFRLLLSPFCIE